MIQNKYFLHLSNKSMFPLPHIFPLIIINGVLRILKQLLQIFGKSFYLFHIIFFLPTHISLSGAISLATRFRISRSRVPQYFRPFTPSGFLAI